MGAVVKLRKGRLEYPVLGHDSGVLTLKDPHTGKRFKVPNAVALLKTCGYKVVKRKT